MTATQKHDIIPVCTTVLSADQQPKEDIMLDQQKITILYCRLSNEDAQDGESNSIANQREYLTRYARDHGYTNLKILVDDGYTGTNFNRPGVQEGFELVKQGLVGCWLVKDLSRFGRDYLTVGQYTDIIFPSYDVRFIAINDGVDSNRGDSEGFAAIRNLFNEWYARDCSRKQRAVARMKGMSGKRISTHPPYGYIKGKDGMLVPDEDTAWVVKLIFDLCIQGLGPVQIANELTRRNIPTPGTLAYRRTGSTHNYYPDAECAWSDSTIENILSYKEYLGHTVNFKTYSKSYKLKKRMVTPEDQQMVFENTHEALVSPEDWETVQRIRERRRRPKKQDTPALFSGMLFCADCGSPLRAHRGQTVSKGQECYCCGKYRDRTKSCTMHYIRAVTLEKLILDNLKQVVQLAQEDEQEFVRRLTSRSIQEQKVQVQSLQKELAQKEHRANDLDNIIKRLYEDSITGKLSDERFRILSADYEQEQQTLRGEIQDIQAQLAEIDSKTVNIDSFLKVAKKYTAFDELTPGMLHDLIEKIVIHEGDKSSGHRQQRIDIYYTFIGEAGASQVIAQRKLKGKVA